MAQKVTGFFPTFLDQDASSVARKLLGCFLIKDTGDHLLKAKIIETESYDQSDAASHSFSGQTSRTDVMFGESGHLYIYFTYGMHYCCNVVSGKPGEGSAVLIRAVEPMDGVEHMQTLRNKRGHDLTNGPAKLCQALGIDKSFNGHNLRNAPLMLVTGLPVADDDIVTTTRVGISKAKHEPRRFYIRANEYISRV